MNKIIKILLIVLLTIILLGLVVAFVMLLNNKIDFKMFQSKLVYNENIVEPFNSIQVSTTSFDIKLVKSEDSYASVNVYDKNDSKVSVKVKDNTLIIDNNYNKSWSFLFFGKKEIIISLPENEYNFVANSTSGDIISKLNLNTVNIVTTSGDIKFNKVNDLELKSSSGDIEISEVDNATITSSSGDVKIGKTNNSLNIELLSGDIDIDNLTIMKDSSIKVSSGDVTINKSSDNIYYDANSKSGDIKINNNNRHADYEVKIDSKSGNVIIK